MEFFSKVLRPGSSTGEHQPSGHETVERLCDRVESATLLDDRRDAVRALKSLAKKFRVEVGTRAMDLLINVLTQDRSDVEIVGLALEALVNVMGPEELTYEDKAGLANHSSDLGVQFTEIYLKTIENVTTLLELLEEYDFRVRWPAVRLLTVLLMNKAAQIQQAILVSPLGVPRLMDLLCDSRDVIRNDGLLLLTHLCKGNAAIQKIVAFENAFDRLFEIIAEEGYCDGGIVVQDCLLLLLNLLKANVSNQNFFREGSYIQRFKMCLELESEGDWGEQKIANVLLTLQVIRTLVSPSNPAQATQSSQRIIYQCGLLNQLCDVIMSASIPTEALTEAVNTVAEGIRGCQSNQEYFASVKAPGEKPLSAAVVLLGIIINEKHQFSLRCAFLYCFQCFLYKYQAGQAQVISTLLPSSTAEAGVTAGQLLCSGLFRPDPFSNWAAATALSHALKGSKDLKEQLLRVQLATGPGNAPVSLLQQNMVILAQGTTSIQTRVGILALLCSWLTACPLAVTAFLQNTAYIPFLTASVESHGEENEFLVQGLSALLIGVCIIYNNQVEHFSSDDIKRLLMTRIDPEHFLSKINDVSKSSHFTDAAKSTEIQSSDPADVLFDNEFTKLFKKLEASISKALQTEQDEEPGENEKSKIPEAHDSIVASYKELIRSQDAEISELKAKCKQTEKLYSQAERQLQTQAIELTQLRAQIELSKGVSEETGESETQASALLQSQLNALKDELLDKDEMIRHLECALSSTQQALEERQADSNAHQVLAMEYSQHDKTTLQLTNQAMVELDALRSRIRELEEERATVGREQEPTRPASPSATAETSSRVRQLESELLQARTELQEQNRNYEDLLVLLDDQDKALNKYKERLKALGEAVDEDEEDNDEGSEEVDEEGDEGVSDKEEADDGAEESGEEQPQVQVEQQGSIANGDENGSTTEPPKDMLRPVIAEDTLNTHLINKVGFETSDMPHEANGSVRGESELDLSYMDDDF